MNLDDVIKVLAGLPAEEKAALSKQIMGTAGGLKWVPSPGPQSDAYYSKADILLYGGEPGGGKTSLLLGLAFNLHQRSFILRRQYTDLGAITDEAIRLNGTRKGFNGSPPPSLTTKDGRLIEFGAAARVGDEQHWQGNPHDFIGVDEGTQFAEVQIRFFMGWLRSVIPGQRTRVVLATNPPLSSEGAWVVTMFAPWLDPRHPNPAKYGELRWFVTDEFGNDQEADGPESVLVGDKMMEPLSRTFIPASVSDNPYLANTNYRSKLDALPEPFRSILMGQFRNTFRDAPNQCIPTAWIKAAIERWHEHPPLGVPMCTMGVDVAQGGTDDTIIAIRHDGWYAPFIAKPGRETPLGKDVAGMIISYRRDKALVVLDMGGGYGGATYEHLIENNIDVVGYKGANKVETRTADRQLKFVNKRTEAYWRFREALDPSQDGGSRIMLPDDPKMIADLTAPIFESTLQGLKLESKEDVCTRLGRSTDCGDAVVMAWTGGPKYISDGGEWVARRDSIVNHTRPNVVMGKNVKRK